jgi:excisionase family DNA binding protein
MDTQDFPFLFDVKATARILSISRSAVYELIRKGELETVKIGRSRRVTQGQLNKFIASLT